MKLEDLAAIVAIIQFAFNALHTIWRCFKELFQKAKSNHASTDNTEKNTNENTEEEDTASIFFAGHRPAFAQPA